jgi:hypothetical protein
MQNKKYELKTIKNIHSQKNLLTISPLNTSLASPKLYI